MKETFDWHDASQLQRIRGKLSDLSGGLSQTARLKRGLDSVKSYHVYPDLVAFLSRYQRQVATLRTKHSGMHHEPRSKANSSKDGESLMMNVWDPNTGVLKITACQSDTDRNVQNGIKFLSAGLMRAIRNPTAHEPALHWPIDEQDATDILAFVSFLLRQHDRAVYVTLRITLSTH